MKDLKPSSTECIYGSCEAPQSSTLDLPLCDRHAIKSGTPGQRSIVRDVARALLDVRRAFGVSA